MQLTLMSYNIRGLMWKDDNTNDLARVIKDKSIELCCLQEVIAQKSIKLRKGFRKKVKYEYSCQFLTDLLHQLGPDYSAVYKFYEIDSNFAIGNSIVYKKSLIKPVGQALSKRYPLISQRGFIEEFSGKFFKARPKSILSQMFKLGDRHLIISNCHLDIYGGDIAKVIQIGDLLKFWKNEKNNKDCLEFILGDFNTWSPYKIRNIFEDRTLLHKYLQRNEFEDLVDEIPWTQEYDVSEAESLAKNLGMKKDIRYKLVQFLGRFVKQDLDHIWGRGELNLINNERLKFRFSDHYPIICKVDV